MKDEQEYVIECYSNLTFFGWYFVSRWHPARVRSVQDSWRI